MKNRRVTARCPQSLYDHRQADNRYSGKWQSKYWGSDVYHVTVSESFKHNLDGTVWVLYDMRKDHGGYLGCVWVTDQFEAEGVYPYVAETESGQAKLFEYDRDAVNWLLSQH